MRIINLLVSVVSIVRYLIWMLLLVGLLFLGQAFAQCTIVGDSSQTRYDYTWEQNAMPTADMMMINVDCVGHTVIQVMPRVNFYVTSGINTLVSDMKPSYYFLNMTVKIVQVNGNEYPGGHFKWDFVDYNYQTLSGQTLFDSYGGRYRILIENHNAEFRSDKDPRWPWPSVVQEFVTFSNTRGSLTFDTRLSFSGDINPCKIDAFQIKTLPSDTISFGSLSLKSLNEGMSFLEPFSIEVSRLPESECKDLIKPYITFFSDHARRSATELILDDSGLLLMIRDGNNQAIAYDEKKILGTLELNAQKFTTNYQAQVRKDPSKTLSIGNFNGIVRYIVTLR